MLRPLKLAAIPLVFVTLGLTRTALAVTDTYTFRNTLQSTEGGATGNTLVPTYNNGTFVGGAYADVTINASACANTPTVRGYAFPTYGGLKSLNTSPVVATGSYTISMIVKFSPLRSGYTRLIDFSDSTQDDGIYVLNNGVSFYPVGAYAPNSFQDDQFSVMTITRNSATDEVSLFIGLTAAGVYVDTVKRYVPTNGNLYFFMDNSTGSASISESSPGVVPFLRVSDQPITSAGLAASIDQACNAVACGNGKIEAAEGCDDGNNVDGDGCSKSCKIDNGKACNTSGDAGVAGAASCASKVCDAKDGKCGYDNGAGSACDAASATNVCRSGSCGSSSLKCVPLGGCVVDADCASKQCNTQTLACVGSTADAGSDAGATEDSGATDGGATEDSGATAGNDAGVSDTDAGTAGEASSGCSCDVGPRRTHSSALAFFIAGVILAARRRIKRRALAAPCAPR